MINFPLFEDFISIIGAVVEHREINDFFLDSLKIEKYFGPNRFVAVFEFSKEKAARSFACATRLIRDACLTPLILRGTTLRVTSESGTPNPKSCA